MEIISRYFKQVFYAVRDPGRDMIKSPTDFTPPNGGHIYLGVNINSLASSHLTTTRVKTCLYSLMDKMQVFLVIACLELMGYKSPMASSTLMLLDTHANLKFYHPSGNQVPSEQVHYKEHH
jgi:hypothetical protein